MESRINVLLDLDNTIINALDIEERHNIPAYFQDKFDHKDMVPFFRIFARPGLQDFLDFLFANFNVGVFTAAEHAYAKFIIDQFILKDPRKSDDRSESRQNSERKLELIFFRYHFELTHKLYNKTKGLDVFWDFFHVYNFYPCNTVIIDDLGDVKKSNPFNTIPIFPFDVMKEGKPNWDAVNDEELQRVAKMLKDLKDQYEMSDCVKKIYNNRPRYDPILELFSV